MRILQALNQAALERQEAALRLLGEALEFAAPQGYIRCFLDEGPAVARLLPLVRGATSAFVDQVRQAFGELPPAHSATTPGAASPRRAPADALSLTAGGTQAPAAAAHPALAEPLTPQELRILRLLAEGLSYQEIADQRSP